MTGVRTIGVYRGTDLVLTVADRPGVLLSTAAPPPEGAPAHPFVDARAVDPFSEQELATLLRASASYDDFVAQLIGAGFDVAPGRDDRELPGGGRLVRAGEVVGVFWDVPGVVAGLGPEPEGGWQPSPVATLTAYGPGVPDELAEAGLAEDPGSLRAAIAARGLAIEPHDD